MQFENFLQFAVKATCIFCNAEKAIGIEEYCNDSAVVEDLKQKAKDTFIAEGWSVIVVKSVAGAPDVMGMACPKCRSKGTDYSC